MIILTKYRLSGKVIESRFIDLDEITKRDYSNLGQKVRITTKDGKAYAGFADEPYHTGRGKSLTLMCYDIDYEKHKLRSSNMTITFIPLDIVVKIEAILYSNPRWGTGLTNKFEFSKPVKYTPEEEKKLQKIIDNFNAKKTPSDKDEVK